MTSKRKPPSPKEEAKEHGPKHPVGRPPLEFSDPIPDTPESIARVVLNTKPKKRGEWRFEKLGARKFDR